MAEAFVCKPFDERIARFAEMITHEGWMLKRYEITHEYERMNTAAYESGLRKALADLPRPARAPGRPGLGFVIQHQGREWHYLVLCWWENENELISRTYRRRVEDDAWKYSPDEGSFCVWDMEVMWFERNVYVRFVMGELGVDVDSYLRSTYPIWAGDDA